MTWKVSCLLVRLIRKGSKRVSTRPVDGRRAVCQDKTGLQRPRCGFNVALRQAVTSLLSGGSPALASGVTLPWHIWLNHVAPGTVHWGALTWPYVSLVLLAFKFCQYAPHLAAHELPDHERQALAMGHGVFPLGHSLLHTGDAVVKEDTDGTCMSPGACEIQPRAWSCLDMTCL